MSIFPITTRTRLATGPSFAARRSRRSRCRGSVALAALTALVVVFIIGLGLLTLGGNTRLSGKRAMRLNGAQAAATAGVEYGYWQRVYNGQPLPYTGSRALGSGSFSVTVTDNSASIAGTIQVVSIGTQSGDSVKLTRILAVKKTLFDYALYSGSNLTTTQTVTTGAAGANGDMGANGYIYLNGSGTVVNGNANATGSIAIRSITGTATPNGPGVTFPAINTAYYQGIAAVTYNGNQTFNSGFTFPAPVNGLYPVIVVNGNVTVGAGKISGTGTVVVTGNVTVTGNLSYLYTGNKIAILCAGNLINAAPSGTPLNVVGFYYSHNSNGNATVQQSNSATMTITGSLTADNYSIAGPLVAIHDPAMDGTLGSQMRLPGY